MLVPIRWLKELVKTDLSPQEIASALTMVGLEVEELTRTGPAISGVVTAKVLSVKRHPNADKLSLCEVTDGQKTYSVVCGARNVSDGITVSLARIGAVLPGDFKIKRSKIRGVESEGMICSEKELALSEESEGILHLASDQPLNVPIDEALGLADWVLNVNVTANRPDCLSILGVARELACATGTTLMMPIRKAFEEEGDIHRGLEVTVEAPAGCPRYSAARVMNVKVGPSPSCLARYLEACGIRPINNVVDITNYCMLESGHPMHAFDARMIEKGHIIVRWARDGERLMTLDGTTQTLVENDLLITDPVKAIALAGVMGGEYSGISDSTTDVVLEAAYFDPVTIRRTSKRLRLHTESSHRFERGCDPEATIPILARACGLLAEHASGRIVRGVIDRYTAPIPRRRITVRTPRVNHVLGTSLDRFRMEKLVKSLGMVVEELLETNLYYDPEKFVVIAPTSRPDLTDEIDVIEEIARLHGYDNIAAAPPVGAVLPVPEDLVASINSKARAALVGLGLSEAISFPFSNRPMLGAVHLANPLKEDESWLRTSLLESEVTNLLYNLNHQNMYVNLFELGRVFSYDPARSSYHQEYRLAILMAGERENHWRRPTRKLDYYAIKGVVETLFARLGIEWKLETGPAPSPMEPTWFHPARSARIVVKGRPIGIFGELHPGLASESKIVVPVVVAEIAIEELAAIGPARPEIQILGSFPRADRDLALIVPDRVAFSEIERVIDEVGGRWLEECRLFDVFAGSPVEEGKRSLAFSLAFRHPERTLTDVEVEKSVQRIVERLEKEFGTTLRDR